MVGVSTAGNPRLDLRPDLCLDRVDQPLLKIYGSPVRRRMIETRIETKMGNDDRDKDRDDDIVCILTQNQGPNILGVLESISHPVKEKAPLGFPGVFPLAHASLSRALT